MGVINGRGLLEIQADLEPVRGAIPGVEAKLAEAEALVAPAHERFLAQRELGDAAGMAWQEARESLRRAEAEAQRYSYDNTPPPREVAQTVERLRREVATAKQGLELARSEEHRAQRAYNAASLAASEHRRHLQFLRYRENALGVELEKAERRDAQAVVVQAAARGWLDRVRERVAGAA